MTGPGAGRGAADSPTERGLGERARPGEPGCDRDPPKAAPGRAGAGRSERCRLTNSCCPCWASPGSAAASSKEPAPRAGRGGCRRARGAALCAEERGLAAPPPSFQPSPFLLFVFFLTGSEKALPAAAAAAGAAGAVSRNLMRADRQLRNCCLPRAPAVSPSPALLPGLGSAPGETLSISIYKKKSSK